MVQSISWMICQSMSANSVEEGPQNTFFDTTNKVLQKQKNKPTGASTNPKNFDLNKNSNMNLIKIEI